MNNDDEYMMMSSIVDDNSLRNMKMHIIKYDEQEYEYVKTTSQNICDQFRPDEMRRADRQTVTCLLLTN